MRSQSAQPPEGPLGFGEPLPFFSAETDGAAKYALDVAAGRWFVLMAFGSLAHAASAAAHAEVLEARALFDDEDASFFGISADPADRQRVRNVEPGLRYFWDFDRRVSALLGVVGPTHFNPTSFLIDRSLRVSAAVTIEQTGALLQHLRGLLATEKAVAEPPHAPVLMLERVFEPELCDRLTAYFKAAGGEASGFASDVQGRTVTVVDARFKRRSDVTIADPDLLASVRERLSRRLFPLVRRAFGWQATEIERDLICEYRADDLGFFSAHRDDATAGTAHRKFAVTVNLNDDYEGGALRFREFGPRLYRPSKGGAAVFSCSLLHEATPVTAGVRYALVPFLYDEAGARLRRANLAQVEGAAGTNRKARRAQGRR